MYVLMATSLDGDGLNPSGVRTCRMNLCDLGGSSTESVALSDLKDMVQFILVF